MASTKAELKKRDAEPAPPSATERNTQLAADRTVFAAERTYGAWVRTGLAALASAIGTKTLLAELLPDWAIRGTGSLLALFSAFCFGAAVWRGLFPGPPPPKPDVRQIPWRVLAFLNVTLMVVAVVALVSILFAPTPGAPQP
jgi:putative membrane protein